MTYNMQTRLIEAATAAAAGSITYSWVSEATDISVLVAAVIGAVTACFTGWFYFERALKMRKERTYEDQKRRDSRRASLLNGDRDSMGRDKTE